MDNSFDRFKKGDLKYSITDDTLQYGEVTKDGNAPYTLIEWLENSGLNFSNTDQFISQYNDYLHLWTSTKNQSSIDNKKTITETYVNLLKEIVLNYTTNEEKRYFATLDYSNPLDLDAVIPFFAHRLKDIILYIVKKRNEIKYQKIKFNLYGSVAGLKKLIYNNVIQILEQDKITLIRGTNMPTISATTQGFQVHINELYDLSEDYYDTGSSVIDSNPSSGGSVY